MRRILGAVALVVVVVGWVGTVAGQVPAPPAISSYSLAEFGVVPRPSFLHVLVDRPAVRDDLKIDDAQVEAVEADIERWAEAIEKLPDPEVDREKFDAARAAAYREADDAFRKALRPEQYDRLGQIQLQAQGPLAFKRGEFALLALGGGRDLKARLRLDDAQAGRLRAIATEGEGEIRKAAEVLVVLPPGLGPTREAIEAFVAGPEFRNAKRAAREAARAAWAATTRRIEDALTAPQRAEYRELLGPPFDLSRLRDGAEERDRDARQVADALGGVVPAPADAIGVVMVEQAAPVAQGIDPEFDPSVARPAYPARHPKVLFDEAHANFHTASGLYQPFARLIGNDGYEVIPSAAKFAEGSLDRGDILVIANALGAEGPDGPGAAIAEGEADAVRDWVRGGGSLLLITDLPRFSRASASLAGRFGVEMSLAVTGDPAHSEGDDPSHLAFSRENKLLGDHPITRGRGESERVEHVRTFAGQSLKGPEGSTALLKLGENATDTPPGGREASAAGRSQGLAFAFGKGRVVVLGEAGQLSAQVGQVGKFGMNVPGLDNRRFALNIMHWLSGLLEPGSAPGPAKP